MRDKIQNIIESAIDVTNQQRQQKIPKDDLPSIRLYGTTGVFDSMQLVNFLVLVEQKLTDELDLEVSLTSEKAVSMKVSPFSSVRSLVRFIEDEIGLEQAAGGM
jgi:acyl carrier protein